MANGLVYILTNPCLDGWVKIGMTSKNDVSQRLKDLNSPTNIPLSYQCYATYEVENPKDVEQCIHRLIDKVDLSLHAIEELGNGTIRKREFFKLTPEAAFSILEEVANLRGDSTQLKRYNSTNQQLLDDINFINSGTVSSIEEPTMSTATDSSIGSRIKFRKGRQKTANKRKLSSLRYSTAR